MRAHLYWGFLVLVGLPHLGSAVVIYGPQGCVSLDRSETTGTCVLKTNCKHLDLSSVEFAFNCETANHKLQRHSFGVGGFDEVEEFDTAVKCAKCEAPTDRPANLPPPVRLTVKKSLGDDAAGKANAEPAENVAEAKKEKVTKKDVQETTSSEANAAAGKAAGAEAGSSKVVKFGPKECVSTYKGKTGSCVMETNCEPKEISGYEFGLICIEKDGTPVRHLFGKGSFDPTETFDTLILCEQCMGMEDVKEDATAVSTQVEEITSDVKGISDDMKALKKEVAALKEKVGANAKAADAGQEGSASDAGKEEPANSLVAQVSSSEESGHQKKSLMRHKKTAAAISHKKKTNAKKKKKAASKRSSSKHNRRHLRHREHHREREEEEDEEDQSDQAEERETDDEDDDRQEDEQPAEDAKDADGEDEDASAKDSDDEDYYEAGGDDVSNEDAASESEEDEW